VQQANIMVKLSKRKHAYVPQNTTTMDDASTDFLLSMCMAGYFGRPEADSGSQGQWQLYHVSTRYSKEIYWFADYCGVC
jgi:hypothetical protein